MFLCTKCKLGFMDFQNYCSTIVDKGKLDGTVEDRGSKSFRISRVPRQSAIFSMIRLPFDYLDGGGKNGSGSYSKV